jgi:hypothetical protein
MNMDWEGLFKKYIWNEQTTPYFTKVSELNQRQGKSEIILYSLLLGVFFGIVSLFSIGSSIEQHGPSAGLYGFSVVCAAVIFGIMKNYYAALYLSASPLASLAYLFFHGLSSDREKIDTLIVTILLLLLLRYSIRIVAIAKSYPSLPIPKDPFHREKGGGL